MTDPVFREATMADHSSLLGLEQKIIEAERPYDPYIRESNVTYYDLENLISSAESYVVVVESDSEIIGSGYAQIRTSKACHSHDSHCYLGFIYLDSAHRGKSIGQGILDNLKQWGMNRGLSHFQLDVYSDNVAAIRAYEKAGFEKVSVNMRLVV